MSPRQKEKIMATTAGTSESARLRTTTRQAISRNSFCTLATSSLAAKSHVTGVLYVAVDDALYVNTFDSSIKVRNIRENPQIAVTIPFKRVPLYPPFCVQFQGKAEVLAVDDPRIVQLLQSGKLKRISSHGELDLPGSCFIRVTPARRVSTFGLGVSLWQFLRNPLKAGRHVELV
jgi:general stress protein 26